MNLKSCRWQESRCETSGEEAIVRADFWVSLSETTRHMDHAHASLSRGTNGIAQPLEERWIFTRICESCTLYIHHDKCIMTFCLVFSHSIFLPSVRCCKERTISSSLILLTSSFLGKRQSQVHSSNISRILLARFVAKVYQAFGVAVALGVVCTVGICTVGIVAGSTGVIVIWRALFGKVSP